MNAANKMNKKQKTGECDERRDKITPTKIDLCGEALIFIEEINLFIYYIFILLGEITNYSVRF